MASANETAELEDSPAGSLSATTAAERVVYQTRRVSLHCSTVVRDVNGNTSNMHLVFSSEMLFSLIA